MKTETYNLDKLIKITMEGSAKNSWFHYEEEKKRWLFGKKEAGFYSFLNHSPISKEEIEKDERLVVKDKQVFFKPHVCLHYVSEYVKSYWFDTLKEAEEFKKKTEDFIYSKIDERGNVAIGKTFINKNKKQ